MNKKGITNLGAALVAVFGTLSLPTAVAASSGDTVVIAGQDGWGFSGDGGPATQASLHDPVGVVSDQSGNYLIADSLNNRIRKIDSTGTINTLSSDVSGLRAIAISSDGTLYVATTSQVFRVESLGERTNLITDESFSTSSWDIHGIAVDQVGNVYVASRSEGRVYLIDVTGSVSILVRKSDPLLEDDETVVDGLSSVADVAIDSNSNLFFADQDSHRVFKRNSSGLVTVFAGTGDPDVSGDRGLAVDADVYRPSSLAVDGAGNVFIDNGAIRKVDSAGRICSIYSPYGSYTSQKSLSVDVSGDLVFPSGNRILKLKSPTCLGSAWDEIKNDPQVGLFRQLVEAGGRAESLDACPGSLTVLAPVNSGLEEIADQLGISFEALKGNPALVTGIINDHVSRWRLEFRRVEQGLSYWIGDSDLHWNFTQQPSGAEGTRKVGENIYVNGKFITFGKGTCAGSIFKIDSPISWPPSGNTTFVEWLGPTTPTNSRNLLFELRFSHPITGLTIANFENSGSQQNCTMSITKGEALSEFSSNYFLTGLCQGSGTFAPRLKFLPVTAQTGTRFFANPVGPVIDMGQGKVLEIRKRGDGVG